MNHCLGCIHWGACERLGVCAVLLKPGDIMVVQDQPQEVIGAREASHGDYTKQAATAQALKRLMSGVRWDSLPETHRESLEMIAVKISRILNGDPNNPDHWLDIAGYATLISNLLTKGSHL